MRDSDLWSRRQWLAGAGAVGAAALVDGCALPVLAGLHVQRRLTPAEHKLLGQTAETLPILQYQLAGTNLGTVLRQRARAARDLPRRSLARLDRLMRASLARSGGVGLAAPQVGLARRVVLVQLQTKARAKAKAKARDRPVLTCVDPRILRRSADRVDGYEACLSIRGVGGLVARARWVELSYYDLQGRLRQRRSEGWEARIFQHELDHLDGRLYVDLVNGPLLPIEEMRRRLRRPRRPSSSGRFEPGLLTAQHPGEPQEVVAL
jgi:peptide deformylase